MTTKDRINWAIPSGFAVFSNKRVWYVRHYESGIVINTEFEDGMDLSEL